MTPRRMMWMAGLGLIGALCLGCQVDLVAGETFACTGDRQCATNAVCHVGVCVQGPILDAGPPEPEPEPDGPPISDGAPADASADAGPPDADRDGDGVPDAVDNCPMIANDQGDLDADGLGDSCDDDMDGDGVINANDRCPQVVDPEQKDRNGNGVGDACEVPCQEAGARCTLLKRTCSVANACGAEYRAFEYRGVCDGTWCGDIDEDASAIEAALCGPQEICLPNAPMPCMPVDACPSDVSCTPEADGAACALAAEPGRGARCVDGACRAWDCMAPECNEVGARRFSLNVGVSIMPLVIGQPGVRIQQPGTGLAWAFPDRDLAGDEPGPPSRSLADAHRRCTTLVFDGHSDWRLPTMHELHAMSASAGSPRFDTLEILARTDALFYSRTVVGEANVMAITLVNAVGGPIPVQGVDAQVVCVRSETPAVRDLTLRRAIFDDWRARGDVVDPHTNLLWTDLGNNASFDDADLLCNGIGASIPSIDALATLLTFNSGPALPAPGSWLAFDNGRVQPSNLRAWSFATTPAEGEHLHLHFRTGEVSAVQDISPLNVLCVTWPEGPGE